jgi:hypothetical protein
VRVVIIVSEVRLRGRRSPYHACDLNRGPSAAM